MRHRVIWQQMRRMYDEGKKPDVIALIDGLKRAGELDQVGGMELVSGLPDLAPSAANLPNYLGPVRDCWMARRMISACTQTVNELMEHDGKKPMEEVLAGAELRIQGAAEARVASSERTLSDVMVDIRENMLEKFKRGHKHRIGPQTGFNYLDNILPGLGKGQLITMAARPRTGKSAWMMQVAEHVALVEKEPVGVFSLEMTAQSLGIRELFQKAGADLTKFLNGFLVDEDLVKVMKASVELSKAPIIIDESPRMSVEDFEVKARRLVRKRGVKLLICDYFQLMYLKSGKERFSRAEELGVVSMRLKALAKELEVPIVLCAQMNRQIEQDANRRPRLSDLKDTGQLEQDSDVVMFLWKPPIDMTNEKQAARVYSILGRVPVPDLWKGLERNSEGKNWKGYMSLVNCTVEKQREGRSGEDALLVFIKPWTRFVDAYNA
jgi:replicative DNA helicase